LQNIELSYQAKKALCLHLKTANHFFDRTFSMPSLNFNLRGKTAGKAYLQLWEIRLNPVLFRENREHFLNEVIPHELAHLITFSLFGRVKPHGKEWKMVMEEVFGVPAQTTHSFETASVQGKTFEYQCHCNRYPLSIRRHNKVLKGSAQYSCKQCNKILVYTGTQLS
jgi:SprT protein